MRHAAPPAPAQHVPLHVPLPAVCPVPATHPNVSLPLSHSLLSVLAHPSCWRYRCFTCVAVLLGCSARCIWKGMVCFVVGVGIR
jgi:hypothetical protein